MKIRIEFTYDPTLEHYPADVQHAEDPIRAAMESDVEALLDGAMSIDEYIGDHEITIGVLPT